MILYLAINLLMLGLIAVCAVFSRWRPSRRWGYGLIGVLVLTAVFDNVIIGLGIVAYDPAKILGLYVFRIPVEDFSYAIGAMILLPAIWAGVERKR